MIVLRRSALPRFVNSTQQQVRLIDVFYCADALHPSDLLKNALTDLSANGSFDRASAPSRRDRLRALATAGIPASKRSVAPDGYLDPSHAAQEASIQASGPLLDRPDTGPGLPGLPPTEVANVSSDTSALLILSVPDQRRQRIAAVIGALASTVLFGSDERSSVLLRPVDGSVG